MTYLTVPIAVENLDKAGRQIKAALAAGAEMLELEYERGLPDEDVHGRVLLASQVGIERLPGFRIDLVDRRIETRPDQHEQVDGDPQHEKGRGDEGELSPRDEAPDYQRGENQKAE